MPERQLHILFIASWYPHRNAPALGNFIQRHAQAASLFNKISVVYAITDQQLAENKFEISEQHSENLSEYIIYYGKIKSKFPFLSQLKKRNAYQKAVRLGIEKAKSKNGNFDLLHVHVIWPAAIAVLPLLNELHVPLLISEHWSGYLPEDGNYKGFLLKKYSKQLADKAKHVTVVSQKMENAMRAHGLGKTFSQLPNAVDERVFSYVKRFKFGPETRLLHVSMLVDREKNISGLLRVMKRLENNKAIQLEIIGDGPERAQHEKLTKELGLLNKTVFFEGFKRPNEIAGAMRNIDALVMFSHFEGMPVTIIEAQFSGAPVIATRVGNIPEMVNEQQGILVNEGDEAALEKVILEIAADKERFSSEDIANAALQKYSMKTVGEKLDVLYRSILQDK